MRFCLHWKKILGISGRLLLLLLGLIGAEVGGITGAKVAGTTGTKVPGTTSIGVSLSLLSSFFLLHTPPRSLLHQN